MLVNVSKESSYAQAKKLEGLRKKYTKIQKDLDKSFEAMAKNVYDLEKLNK